MRKIATLLLVVFAFGMALPAFASPFSDLPAHHWATKAVELLAQKGLVEGFPDGTFRGAQPATRYQVAMIVARLVEYLERQKPQVTKADLDAIRRLVNEYKNELDAMGVRLSNVENTLASLQGQVKKLAAVRLHGGFETRFSTVGYAQSNDTEAASPYQFDSLTIGNREPTTGENSLWDHTHVYRHRWQNNPWEGDVEGYPMNRLITVFPAQSGTALTEVGYFQVDAKLQNKWNAGGTIALYNNQGDMGNGYTYGVTAPTLDNPAYNPQGGVAASGVNTAFLHNLNANLSQIYVQNDSGDTTAVVGDWRPAYIPDFMLEGTPNPGIYGPDYLPFYGGQLYGTVTTIGTGLNYEIAAGKLPSSAGFDSGTPTLWQNEVFGGALGYKFKDSALNAKITGAFVRLMNDSASQPAGTGAAFGSGVDNPGSWSMPNPTTLTPVGIGPQEEDMYGADFVLHFKKNLNWLGVWGKYGNSEYNGNHASSLYNNVSGDMWDAGIAIGKTAGKVTGGADYLDVQPTYDPFISELNVPAAQFNTGLPIDYLEYPFMSTYSIPYTTPFFMGAQTGAGDLFYQAHNSRKYPNNRNGYRAYLNWNYGKGNVGGWYENLTQATDTTKTNEFQPGFYEPVFYAVPGLPNPPKGRIITWYGYADYTPYKELSLSGIYISNQIQRPTTDENNINLQSNWWRAGLNYMPAGNNLWVISAGYDQFLSNGAGQYLESPTTHGDFLFKQFGPYVGVNYNFTKNAQAWIMYNQFYLNDNSDGASVGAVGTHVSGYNGTQVSSGLRFLF